MPEIGLFSRKEAAALAGLAPYDQDSGATRATAITGGRSRLRKASMQPRCPPPSIGTQN